MRLSFIWENEMKLTVRILTIKESSLGIKRDSSYLDLIWPWHTFIQLLVNQMLIPRLPISTHFFVSWNQLISLFKFAIYFFLHCVALTIVSLSRLFSTQPPSPIPWRRSFCKEFVHFSCQQLFDAPCGSWLWPSRDMMIMMMVVVKKLFLNETH